MSLCRTADAPARRCCYRGLMNVASTRTDISFETVGDLRSLHREAESRALRLRLLLEVGHDLACVTDTTLHNMLGLAARRVAHFCGYSDGRVAFDGCDGLALTGPGVEGQTVGWIILDPREGPVIAGDDQRVLGMVMQWMAMAIVRVEGDRDRARLLDLLQERERRLEMVVTRLFNAQEEERRRVSHELHDGIAQLAGALFRQLEVCAIDLVDDVRPDLASATSTAQSLMREIRAIIAGLRPTTLDDLGLAAAVLALSDQMRLEGYELHLEADQDRRWPDLIQTGIYRVVQEALNNVRKHAGGPCRIELRLEETRHHWSATIRDFGRGFDASTVSAPVPSNGHHIGLDVMRERMSAIGGVLSIESSIGTGTEVRAMIPREAAA